MRILAVHYSQSGQMTEIVESLLAPLRADPRIEVVSIRLRAEPEYPFPWTLYRFLDAFPESVLLRPPAIEPVDLDTSRPFDLVILGYTVWYLAPAPPMIAFLRSPAAAALRGAPVVTVVNARDKWLTAQESMKAELTRLGARLVDLVALVHEGNGFQHLVTTLRWMLTGRRDPFWRVFPRAGVPAAEVAGCRRLGEALLRGLSAATIAAGAPPLRGLGAVKVDGDALIQERVAVPNFRFWARVVRLGGGPGAVMRVPLLLLFGAYLLGLLCIAAPVVACERLLRPLFRRRFDRLVAYHAGPSGLPDGRQAQGDTA